MDIYLYARELIYLYCIFTYVFMYFRLKDVAMLMQTLMPIDPISAAITLTFLWAFSPVVFLYMALTADSI